MIELLERFSIRFERFVFAEFVNVLKLEEKLFEQTYAGLKRLRDCTYTL